jgi:hypothetical protein
VTDEAQPKVTAGTGGSGELTAGFDAGWRGRLIDRATYEE